MRTKRFHYAVIVLIIIGLGILSRKLVFVPLFVGDLLYAVMIFYLLRIVFVKASAKKIALAALLICLLIELSQLYQAIWINGIRKTLPGRYILGEGFLWSDLAAYVVGTAIAFLGNRHKRSAKASS